MPRSRKRKRITEVNEIRKSKRNKIDWSEWVSGSTVRNHILNDPIIDWLNLYGEESGYLPDTMRDNYIDETNFTKFIMAKGQEFEDHVIALMKKQFKNDIITVGGGHLDSQSVEKAEETEQAMRNGVPFIYQGVVHNHRDMTYGSPDLIVRSDYLNRIVRVLGGTRDLTLDRTEYSIPSPTLNRPYHYRIVDVKFSTLNLNCNGEKLLNSDSTPAYKAQMLIYNNALGFIQGYTPPCAYILGRKWKYTSARRIYRGRGCFDKLGVIDFNDRDLVYYQRTENAVRWIRELRKDGKNWIVGSRPELFPNMGNNSDTPWHYAKIEISNNLEELTKLWYCGVKNRKVAHENKIYRLSDPSLTAVNLGVGGTVRLPIIQDIIKINQQNQDLIRPKKVDINLSFTNSPNVLEFYVDFETVNDVNDDFKNLPIAGGVSMIYMIGCGYYNCIEKNWEFKSFVVRSLTLDNERDIIEKWLKYMAEVTPPAIGKFLKSSFTSFTVSKST